VQNNESLSTFRDYDGCIGIDICREIVDCSTMQYIMPVPYTCLECCHTQVPQHTCTIAYSYSCIQCSPEYAIMIRRLVHTCRENIDRGKVTSPSSAGAYIAVISSANNDFPLVSRNDTHNASTANITHVMPPNAHATPVHNSILVRASAISS
jgi:hypothetical protein